jgi:hypothetical protein
VDLSRCYARGPKGVNRTAAQNEKEKNLSRHNFRPAKCNAHFGCAAASTKRLKLFDVAAKDEPVRTGTLGSAGKMPEAIRIPRTPAAKKRQPQGP